MKSALALAMACLAAPALAQAPPGLREAQLPSPDEISVLAKEAYIYGYPLVTLDAMRSVMTNVATPGEARAPLNQLATMSQLPHTLHDANMPTSDTCDVNAWIDLSEEPMVFAQPDMGDRYFLFPFFDAYSNVFAVAGTRATGPRAQTYLLTGPGWRGTLPEGMKRIRAPTNAVWLPGHVECNTPADAKVVDALEDGLELLPLSAWGAQTYKSPRNRPNPDIEMKVPVREQVNALSAEAFFDRLARLLAFYPPPKADAEIVAKLARLGIIPGQHFSTSRMNAARIEALRAAPRAALEEMQAQAADVSLQRGWAVELNKGAYGTNYLQRAAMALVNPGAPKPEDEVAIVAHVDGVGQPLSGANRYEIHIPKDEAPPVHAFWSITIYGEQMSFVGNALNKHTVSARDALKPNADGSLDILVQAEPPAHEKEANWLPAPKEGFTLVMRMHWPREKPPSVLDGSWAPPPVSIVSARRLGRAPPHHRHR